MNNAIQNIINYIRNQISNTQDNWIKKATYEEMLDVAKVNLNKNKTIDNIIDYIIQEMDKCKNNYIRSSTLKSIWFVCNNELNVIGGK